MDFLWVFLGLLAAAALAVGIWRTKAMGAASYTLDSLYARRQGLVVELLKVAESPSPEVTRVLDNLAALEQQISVTPKANRPPPIEATVTAALHELYALADHDDDLMANHEYVLIQAHLAEVERHIETQRRS